MFAIIPTGAEPRPWTGQPTPESARLHHGDAEALESAYQEFHRYVMATAVRVLRDQEEAEEVVQDVFLALWRRPPKLPHGINSLIAWLAVTTKRMCWLRLRRAERRPHLEQLPEDSDLGRSDPALDRIAEDLQRRKFEAALRQITPKHRQVLMLVYYEDVELTEVALQLEMPVVTVRKWFASGILRLRRRFEVAKPRASVQNESGA